MTPPTTRSHRWALRAGLLLAAAAMPMVAVAQGPVPAATPSATAKASEPVSLDQQFRDPPSSARPRVWWHWMNGNVTEDGIAKDIDWMQRVGIGGLQAFDAGLEAPQVVAKRLTFMSPEWKQAFRFAARTADAKGLELAIASSPGWSETGGPWVQPVDGLKKVVWSETVVAGGQPIGQPLVAPPVMTGPFQDIGLVDPMSGRPVSSGPAWHADIAVLAVPVAETTMPLPQPRFSGPDGKALDAGALTGDSFRTTQLVPHGSAEQPSSVLARFDAPQTVRALTFFVSGAKPMFGGPVVAPRLEASSDGSTWTKIADIAVTAAPTTVSFPAVTARAFRVVLQPLPFSGSNMSDAAPGADTNDGFLKMMAAGASAPWDLRHFALHAEPRIDHAEAKSGFATVPDYYALGMPDAGATGPAAAQVIDLTAKLRPDGTLDWVPPAGNAWRILRFGTSLLGTTNHPAAPEATGLEVDKFDGAAVRRQS